MASAPTFEALKDEYARLWAAMEIRASKAADIEATAQKIAAKKTRYQAVEEQTGVPWYVVGVIHAMESGCNFATHLHNGDPLSARTRLVPAGRPRLGAPPFQWKASACDALTLKNLEAIEDWSIERIAFELERYNGWGYRNYHPSVLSPYLWSGTNHYARGKYVADGKWSSSAVSGQSGAMPILKCITGLDAEVHPALSAETDVKEPRDLEEKLDPVAAFPSADVKSAGTSAEPRERSKWLSGTLFDEINQLVEKGSRLGLSVRNGLRALYLAILSLLGIGGGGLATMDPNKGVATEALRPFPVLYVVLISVMLTAVVVGGIGILYLKRAQKGVVTAKRDGRYEPRGGLEQGA